MNHEIFGYLIDIYSSTYPFNNGTGWIGISNTISAFDFIVVFLRLIKMNLIVCMFEHWQQWSWLGTIQVNRGHSEWDIPLTWSDF
jgi:hypothetical protein